MDSPQTAIGLFNRHPLQVASTLFVCLILAIAAMVVASLLHAPAVLFALMFGFAVQPAATKYASLEASRFCSSTILRAGIALIGLRLAFDDFAAIGTPAILLGIGAVLLMLVIGRMIAIRLGLERGVALLTAGSVGICGASAALAIAAALPRASERERQTCYTIGTVTILSTVAMILYPVLAKAAGFSPTQAGLFFGASIHDLIQVIGAASILSPAAMEAATVTKLVRVACLAPTVVGIGMMIRTERRDGGAAGNYVGYGHIARTRPLRGIGDALPWFLHAFFVAALLANTNLLSPSLVRAGGELSTLCLVTATVALGAKTKLSDLSAIGWRPLVAILLQTLVLAGVTFFAVTLLGTD